MPPSGMGGGGLRGEGCGDISPTHIYPQPPPPYPGKNGTTHRHHTTPTLTTIPGQKWNYPPPPYHPHTHEPTPRPPFFRGGEGSKKPLSTPLHHDTPLSGGASRRADRGRAAWVVAERSGASRASRMGGRGAKRSEQGKPHGWSRSGAERAGQAAWVVAERSGASRASRMASRERSERCSSWVCGYASARCPLAPLAQRRATAYPPPLRSAAW